MKSLLSNNLYRIHLSHLVVITILFGFTFNALISHTIIEVRYILVGICLSLIFLIIAQDLKKMHFMKTYIFLFSILLLTFYNFALSQLPVSIVYTQIYLVVAIILGFFIYRYIEYAKQILIYLIILNLIILIYEFLNNDYLFYYASAVGEQFVAGRYKGLFSNSKEMAGFLVSASLLFKQKKNILMLLFISSIFSGSRTAMLFIGVLLLIEFIYYIFKYKLTFLKLFSLISILILIITFFAYYFNENVSMYGRIINSFNFDSSSHQGRFYAWDLHLEMVLNTDFIHLLFGNIGYNNYILGTGAENSYLTTIGNNGLIVFFFFYTPILFFAFLNIFNFYHYYPFILLLIVFQISRVSGGWSEGILLWAYLFYHYNFNYLRYFFYKVCQNEK